MSLFKTALLNNVHPSELLSNDTTLGAYHDSHESAQGNTDDSVYTSTTSTHTITDTEARKIVAAAIERHLSTHETLIATLPLLDSLAVSLLRLTPTPAEKLRLAICHASKAIHALKDHGVEEWRNLLLSLTTPPSPTFTAVNAPPQHSPLVYLGALNEEVARVMAAVAPLLALDKVVMTTVSIGEQMAWRDGFVPLWAALGGGDLDAAMATEAPKKTPRGRPVKKEKVVKQKKGKKEGDGAWK